MKILYIQCDMGAAGDMLMSGLLEICGEEEKIIKKLNNIGICGVEFSVEKTKKCGIVGSHTSVSINGTEEIINEDTVQPEEKKDIRSHEKQGSHKHMGLKHVKQIIDSLKISERVKKDAKAIYTMIAEAEAEVHGSVISNIHFHEVGTMDAIADVVGCCVLMEMIDPQQVVVSPINLGSGSVKCAHGILPVPTPATALILKGVPAYSKDIEGELCTPTGAAILKYFGSDFSQMPLMRIEKIGYGMGKKDFSQANCVRLMLGERDDFTQQIYTLSANIDDMTGEELGFASEQLFAKGALDVYFQPITMKKSRPAVILNCICEIGDKERMEKLIFKNTTTIGIREYKCDRAVLVRYLEERMTTLGKIKVKVSKGYGVTRIKGEYEDLAELAKEHGMSIREVEKELKL